MRPRESRVCLRPGDINAVGLGSAPALEAEGVAATEGRVAVAWGSPVEGATLNLETSAVLR